jgi:anti-anti-sigma regulatory factor
VVTAPAEIDVTKLAEGLDAQLSGQAAHLTIDVSMLRSADSSFITALVAAAVVLRYRGGNLILMHPQQPVLRMLDRRLDSAIGGFRERS